MNRSERPSRGAKAIAMNKKIEIARYRLFLLLSLVLSAAFALGLHLVFGR
ncbi:MAG TPA: hypothetical protein VKX46_05545 [Ktedonobacteraceae bacterium]|nr:hypothetical protein [Ktedonobacteraceae bacterium]